MQLPYSNLKVVHQNPGARLPLILPILVVCNTSDEVINENIRVNSRNGCEWLDSSPAHDGIALLCGSGPSLADNLDEIRDRQLLGAVVYAMNGSAKFLTDNRIIPDYQVLIDARLETADLISTAKQHLIASQCHPECFATVYKPILWHLQIDGIDELLPDQQPRHVMIGGAASVGNTTTCLAYAMGYRELHCYGYDSSNSGSATHAFRQPMNDGDPMAEVTFNRKNYTCSLTMKLQAEKFQVTAAVLKKLGCTIHVHGSGLLPDIYNTPVDQLAKTMSEIEKYRAVWDNPEYRIWAPGEHVIDTFLEQVKPRGTIIDFGCGTGRAGLRLHERGYPVMLIDFADNCRDEAAKTLPFLCCDLTKPIPMFAWYGFCTDVMEHIPTDDVSTVLNNIMVAAPTVFFQISTIPDDLGVLIGQQLHLTVKPHQWWLDLFKSLGYAVQWHWQALDTSLFVVNRSEP